MEQSWTVDDVIAEGDRGEMATRHLIQLGHRRIGYVGDEYRTDSASGFIICASKAIVAHSSRPGWRSGQHLIATGLFGREEARESALRLLRGDAPPTAIVAASDTQAMGVLAAARECGLDVPGQLSVVGYDDIEIPRVSGTNDDQSVVVRESGREGARMLVGGWRVPAARHGRRRGGYCHCACPCARPPPRRGPEPPRPALARMPGCPGPGWPVVEEPSCSFPARFLHHERIHMSLTVQRQTLAARLRQLSSITIVGACLLALGSPFVAQPAYATTLTLGPAAGALSPGQVGDQANLPFNASTSSLPVSFSISAGALPPGLALDIPTSGAVLLSGFPTTARVLQLQRDSRRCLVDNCCQRLYAAHRPRRHNDVAHGDAIDRAIDGADDVR